ICGAGQPYAERGAKEKRGSGIYEADRMANVKISSENPTAVMLYNGLLSGHKAHDLLHYK
ncbi:MAG: iron hydrogenase small subunit, partial [Anaerovorax sp.]